MLSIPKDLAVFTSKKRTKKVNKELNFKILKEFRVTSLFTQYKRLGKFILFTFLGNEMHKNIFYSFHGHTLSLLSERIKYYLLNRC